MDLNFLKAKHSVRKLSAMLISNSSWITAASAFIFPGKSLQGMLMTSRDSLSLGHTVITHCQGGQKRTNRKFPRGKMCFISSPSSCHSSGRRYNWNKLGEEMKAVTLGNPCPCTSAKFWPCSWDAFPGSDARAKAEGYPAQKWGVLADTRLSTPAQGLQLCSSAATALYLHCILASFS